MKGVEVMIDFFLIDLMYIMINHWKDRQNCFYEYTRLVLKTEEAKKLLKFKFYIIFNRFSVLLISWLPSFLEIEIKPYEPL